MKRVTPSPWLPNEWLGARGALLDILREFATSLNQAAIGELREPVSVTGAYIARESDQVIEVTPAAPCTITIPTASKMRGRTVTVKRMNSTTHTISVQPSSGTIDGSASMTLTTGYQVRHFYSNGSVWSEH